MRNLSTFLRLFRSLGQYDNVWVCTVTAWKIPHWLWEVQEEAKRDLRAKTISEKAGEISEDEKGEEENAWSV